MCVNFSTEYKGEDPLIVYTLKLKGNDNKYHPLFFQGTYSLNTIYEASCISKRINIIDIYTMKLQLQLPFTLQLGSHCPENFHKCGWHTYPNLEDAIKRLSNMNLENHKIVILKCKLESIEYAGLDATLKTYECDEDADKEPRVIVGRKITFLEEVSPLIG